MTSRKIATATAAAETAPVKKVESDQMDFSLLRLSPSGMIMTRKALTVVPVRIPRKHEFFRKRPGKEWETELPLYSDPEGGGTFVIGPDCLDFMDGQGLIQRARVHVLIVHGTNIILVSPVNLPDIDGKINPYNYSREEAYRGSETKWLKIGADRSLGAYMTWYPVSALPEPVWPPVPGALNELLNIAFKGKFIMDMNHPLVKQLRGRL